MIFCRTKRTAADVAEQLDRRGFASAAVHGDLGQGAREQALRAFRNGKVDVLVATDVAARGIDVDNVTHVVNYQCPEDEKTYLHRIGRTARAGASGTAVTLVDWDDMPRWSLVNKALALKFPEPVETYSTSPHFFTDLKIPEGATGILPRADRTREGLRAEQVEDLGETGRGGRRSGSGSGSGPSSGSGSRSGGERDRAERPERKPREQNRSRRRLRNGVPTDGEAVAAEQPKQATVPAQAGEVSAPAAAVADAPAKTRRRRTRRPSAEGEVVAAAENVVAEAEAVAAVAAEESKPRRRRAPRAAATGAGATESADAPEAAPQPAVEGEPKPRKRRTRRRPSAAATESSSE
jgi:superfamily II DNA/RNA helicase